MSGRYDVFISFKATDSQGRPTPDARLAEEVYHHLAGKGLSVFFSQVSLEQRGVGAYKSEIDAALDSARVLVAVATDGDHLEARWVRYEWDTFVEDILSGVKPDGQVFAYLDGVPTRRLPRALRHTQALQHGPESLDHLHAFVANALAAGPPVDGATPALSRTRPRLGMRALWRGLLAAMGVALLAGALIAAVRLLPRVRPKVAPAADLAPMVAVPSTRLSTEPWDGPITVRLLRQFGLRAGPALRQMLESTPRQVTVAPFDLGRFEVTNAEYRQFLEEVRRDGSHRSCHPGEPPGKDHTPSLWTDPLFSQDEQPVVGVDWFDAYAYARWCGARLPTDDEWELAARGQDRRPYPWGEAFSAQAYTGGPGEPSAPLPRSHYGSTPQDAPAALGGNVAEWVSTNAKGSSATVRGGAWDRRPGEVYGLAFLRFGASRDYRGPGVGIRCARDAAFPGSPPDMVRIAGGPALLGGEDTPLLGLLRRHLDSVRNVDQALLPPAQPERQVPAFRIDRCEVSDADYRRFLEAVRRSGDDAFRHPAQDAGKDHTPKFWSNPRFSAEAQPVVGVDWFDAYAYARWAGKRLPRADEWEAAARGDSCRLYPWGDEFRPELCVSGEGPVNAPVPVGTTASDLSAAGVCDLGGNVSEWVDADLGGRPAKLILGGDWATDCRLYALTYVRARGAVPTHRSEALGFRCAADVR